MSIYKGYNKSMGISSMKYNKEYRDVVKLNVSKDEKEKWKGYAEKRGLTLSGYIKKLIAEDNAE